MIHFQRNINGAVDRHSVTNEVRTVLLGDIVTMNGLRDIIRNGRLCIQDGMIAAVLHPGEPLPPNFSDAAQVDTEGTIYPGLFDLHNHLPYNMIPLWQVDRVFRNRLEWQALPEYYPAVRAPFSLLNNHPDLDYRRAIVRFTECRNLLGGVTTGHGMGLTKGVTYQGLMRNVEQPGTSELPLVKSQTADMKPEDIVKMMEWTDQRRPFIYHLSEGVDDHARERLLDLQRMPGAINPHLVCIHAVGVRSEDFPSLQAAGGIVWSPTSNLLLYGQTCRIEEAKRHGIPIAIGADWSPSGCKNLLGELKVARAVSQHLGDVLSDAELVAGVTCVPATMIGWDQRLGSIAAGKWADLLILEGNGGDPYARLVEARETTIRAVIIDGRIRLGQASSLIIGEPVSSEKVTIGGKHYIIDLVEPGGDGVGGITLAEALAKVENGLQRLPEFEALQKGILLTGHDNESGWRFEDEMHEDSLESLFMHADHLPAIPLQLAPLTAVDDLNFSAQMRASVNMPGYAKAAFDEESAP